METRYIDIEKTIYLKTLNKNKVYKEYLFSLFDDIDNSVKNCKKFTFKEIVNIIKNLNHQAKKSNRSQLLPILISSDLEKEKFYNSIKEEFQNQKVLYIPLCPIDVRIYYHIYTCLIEDLGLEIFDTINLNSIKFGQNSDKNDAIRALLKYKQFSPEMGLVKRWLLGEKLDSEEENRLGLRTSISENENSLEIIKCICDSFEKPVLLFFDDIELIKQKYGDAYGKRWGRIAELKFLNTFISFFAEIKNTVIILPCIKTSWKILLNFSNNNLQSVLESNKIELFELEGLKRKMMKVMDFYWLQSNIRPPPNSFFPLNNKSIEKIFKKSRGDLKQFFTLCIKNIEDVSRGNKAPAQIG